MALCRRVEEHVVAIETAVSSLSPVTGQSLPCSLPPLSPSYLSTVPPENWDVLDEPLTTLLSTLNSTVSIFKKALYFLILRVSPPPHILPLVEVDPSLSLTRKHTAFFKTEFHWV